MENPFQHHDTLAGTIGGTALVILLQINTAEITHTALLAAIGAGVSYAVSLMLKWVVKNLRRRK